MPAGDLVRVDFRKWPDIRHWQFSMRRLGEDEHGVWLWSPPGTRVQRGHEPPKETSRINVKLITPDRWWTAIWSDRADDELYVDIATPPRWDGSRVTMVDLDYDIVRLRSGGVEVLDEDEFEEHRIALGYPEHVVDRARTTTAQTYLAVAAGAEPFGAVGAEWMARAGRLLEAT